MSRVSSRRIVGGNAGGKTGAAVSLPTTTSSFRRILISEDACSRPRELMRMLTAVQDAAEEATLASRSNPEAGAIILGPYKATGNLLDVDHLLGRAPVSITCARAIGAAWTGYEVSPQPTGFDAKKTVRLQMPATGTFYLRFA